MDTVHWFLHITIVINCLFLAFASGLLGKEKPNGVILGYTLSVPYGTNGIRMSWPIRGIIGTALTLLFYAKGVWKVKK